MDGSSNALAPDTETGKKRRSKWGPLNESQQEPAIDATTYAESAAATTSGVVNKRAFEVDQSASDLGISSEPQYRIQKKKSKMVFKTISTGDLSALTCGTAISTQSPETATSVSGSTDIKGFYRCKISEVLNGKYRVVSTLGEGVFASVVRCIALDDPSSTVAIKIIKKKTESHSCGEKELELYRRLQHYVSENSCCGKIVQYLDTFELSGHRCIVLENMFSNLRNILKNQFHGGLPISLVRTFGRQILLALQHLTALGIAHLDIKPDNILVDQSLRIVKVCDLGSAMSVTELAEANHATYLVARLYRPPELLLQFGERSSRVDVWSAGVTLCELVRGSLLFTGKTSNELFWNIMTALGPPSKRCMKACSVARPEASSLYSVKFSNEEGSMEVDRSIWFEPNEQGWFGYRLYGHGDASSAAELARYEQVQVPNAAERPLQELLAPTVSGKGHSSAHSSEALMELASDLHQLLTLEPTRRLAASDALLLPTFQYIG